MTARLMYFILLFSFRVGLKNHGHRECQFRPERRVHWALVKHALCKWGQSSGDYETLAIIDRPRNPVRLRPRVSVETHEDADYPEQLSRAAEGSSRLRECFLHHLSPGLVTLLINARRCPGHFFLI